MNKNIFFTNNGIIPCEKFISFFTLDDYFKLEHGIATLTDIEKRHIGIPDHGGVQRILQTGTIAPSLLDDPERLNNRFDVIFAMYYINAVNVRAIRPSDLKCIDEFRKKAQNGKFSFIYLHNGIVLYFSLCIMPFFLTSFFILS